MLNQSKFHWLPERVFISEESREDELTAKILAALPAVEVQYLKGRGDPLTEQGLLREAGESEAQLISKGKRQLYLSPYRGEWMKPCPGTLDHVCCNLWVVNPAQGCPLDCTYCALQTYLRRNPTITVFTNTSEMLRGIESRVQAEPKRLFRVCTGELTDSLALDELTGLSSQLIPFFAKLPNAILELKTKTNVVKNVLAAADSANGRTVVSWSVNSPLISERDELYASSLDDRLQAAAQVADAGYRVAFHFDPLVHHPSWEEGYRQTISEIFQAVDPESVAWVSVSALRYHPGQQLIMKQRFPESQLPLGEHFLGSDNKLRIPQPIRFKMLKFVWGELKRGRQRLPVYMCMESAAAWRAVVGNPPGLVQDASEVYARSISAAGESCSCCERQCEKTNEQR